MHHEASIAFRIHPQPHVCRSVREGLTEFAMTHGVPRTDLEQLQTALGEALANAIEHSGSNAEIDIEIRLTADRIVATVSDAGVGFSVDSGLSPLPDAVAERGRGLPIMRRCSDIFGVRSVPGQGTVVVLGRYLRPLCEGAA